MATKVKKTTSTKTEKLNSKSVSKPVVKKKNGGKRPGAGRPKGKKSPAVIEREAALKAFRDRVAKNTERLMNSQMALAEGVSLLFRVDKDSKGKDQPAVQVTDPEEIKQYIDGDLDGDSYYFITTKQPDNRALDSLFDRTYGKAQQNIKAEGDLGVTVALVEFVGDDEDSQEQNPNT